MRSYICLVLMFIYMPLSSWLGVDGAGRGLWIIAACSIVFNSVDPLFREVLKSKYSILWLLLVVYHCINCFLKQVPLTDSYNVIFLSPITCYVIMVLTTYCMLKDRNRALKTILISYGLFLLLAYLTSSTLNEQGRLGGEINANQIAQCAGICALMLSFAKFNFRWSYLLIIILSIIPLVLIFQCISRNGIILYMMFLVSLFLGNVFYKVSNRRLVSSVVLSAVVVFAVYYILNNSKVGERLLDTKEQAENFQYKTDTVLDDLGDRTMYYVLGWEAFVEHPVTGIGMWAFQSYTNSEYPLHTEYMVHLAEGGVIASVLYLWFMLSLVIQLFLGLKSRRDSVSVIAIVGMIAYFIVCFTARAFYYVQFYPLLGICLALIFKESHSNQNQYKFHKFKLPAK